MVSQRHSSDDRRGAATTSPFRSKQAPKRLMAALDMIQKRTTEIAQLGILIEATQEAGEKRRLSVRLSASKNNLASWRDYVEQNYPYVKGAVITP